MATGTCHCKAYVYERTVFRSFQRNWDICFYPPLTLLPLKLSHNTIDKGERVIGTAEECYSNERR